MLPVATLLFYFSTSYAFQFPLSIPSLNFPWPSVQPHRVAIIGAGAGGSSAAFWLTRAQNRTPEHNVRIDVFEKENYIGGRSTVAYPYDSMQHNPMELGASIFVKANKNLWRAVEEFNLSLTNVGDEDGEMGIWDGAAFRFRATMTNGAFSWWDMARLLWRYGIDAPRRSQSLVTNFINQYLSIYESTTPSWENVTDIAKYLNFTESTSLSTRDYFEGQKISQLYCSEFIEAMTRVNYGQNIDQIHALEGLVSQATNGASSVQGGNYQIFEQFLAHSNAKLYLNTTVESLTRKSNKWFLTTTNGESRTYDSVILAAPFHSTGITITPSPRLLIPKQPYVHLHVTLLSTSSPTPNAAYFTLPNDTVAPSSILTTNDGFAHDGMAPEFNSLSYQGKTAGQNGRPAEYLVKIFSSKTLDDAWLWNVFGRVGWMFRKEWDAYPQLPPTTLFPPVRPEENLYYVNSFEPFISTMETETVSSLNAVRLLLTDLWGANATTCQETENTTHASDGTIMLGWDC